MAEERVTIWVCVDQAGNVPTRYFDSRHEAESWERGLVMWHPGIKTVVYAIDIHPDEELSAS